MGLLIQKMKFNFDGGAFAQIYFKKPKEKNFWQKKISYKRFRDYALNTENFHELMFKIAKSKAIEFLLIDHQKHTFIYSKNGIATVKQDGNKYFYDIILGKDPFGYSKNKTAKKLIKKWITKEESLKYSHHTEYPDAIYQIHGLLQLNNAGEIVVTSAKNTTWNIITPYGAHGGIRREQTVMPFISSEKITSAAKFMRTEDVFKYII